MSGTRRSGRLKTIAPSSLPGAPNTSPKHEEEDAPDKSSDKQSPNRRKKRSSTKKKDTPPAKKKRGEKLQKMPDMPLDILFEIFSHLFPYDLLRLSRATKSLRQILMKRSSAFVWKLARVNMAPSFPNCPPGLSEPAYANLAFDSHCHFCGALGAGEVNWALFKRACKTCEGTKYSHCYLHDNEDALTMLSESSAISPDRAMTIFEIDSLPCMACYTFVEKDLKATLLEYEAIEDEENRAEWMKIKQMEKLDRSTFAVAANSWSLEWKQLHLNEIKDRKKRRSAAILGRLRDEGWGDVIDKLHCQDEMNFHNHALVKQNKDLTDRIWKNIKSQMTELFEDRLKRFKEAFNDYCTSLPFDATTLPLENFLAIDPVKTIIFDKRLDIPLGEPAFQEAFSAVPRLAALWKAKFDRHLHQLLASSTEEYASPSKFDLATSLFRCIFCCECHLTYKQVLSHRCSAWRPPPNTYSYPPTLAYTNPEITRVLNEIGFALCLHQGQMKMLLKAYDLPENTMMSRLQAINPLVECNVLICNSRRPNIGRHIMYWHELLSHATQTEEMRVLNHSNFVGKIYQPLLRNVLPEAHLGERRLYGCRHCYSSTSLSFMELKVHLFIVHDIEVETRASMEHYVIHPSVLTHQLSYTFLFDQALL